METKKLCDISKEDFLNLQDLNKKFSGLCRKILYYINVNHYTDAMFNVDKVYMSNYEFEKEFSNLGVNDTLLIHWVEDTIHDCPDGGILAIPMEYVYNNTWRDFIDERYNKCMEHRYESIRKQNEMQEQNERELLKKLKEKYGE